MKKIIFIFTLLFTFYSTQTYAARFGRGKSFGQHNTSQMHNNRSTPKQNDAAKQNHTPQQTPPATPKPSFMSKIFPMLAGLSIGALLGSLLSNGLGGGFTSILMVMFIAGIAFFIIRKLMASRSGVKTHDSFQHATSHMNNPNAGATAGTYYQEPQPQQPAEPAYDTTSYHNYEPLNKEEFLRTAKTIFLRMQNAYDHKNLSDIRTFTTPEVYAEIQMQIQERGDIENHTEVLKIEASFFNENEADDRAASVVFAGQVKEDKNAPATDIHEVWHFIKQDKQWIIAGVEQKH